MRLALAVPSLVLGLSIDARATEWFVAPGGAGAGTAQAPYGSIQAALRVAQPGDTVTVRAGVYDEAIRTVRDGTAGAPITLRAERGRGEVVVMTSGRVLQIDHAFAVMEGLVLDASYAPSEVVDVNAGVRSLVLREVEVRRSSRDCVNIGPAVDVLIERSLIHHCLNATGGRTDAHGIAAGAVTGLTVRDTEIHTFSGDAIQLNRTGTAVASGWDQVLIERCRFWLAPLPRAENGFAAGTVTGENALDTKVAPESPRARITIRDTRAWGFRRGLIRSQATFNLKEKIDAVVDGVTVWDSEIAFRLRGVRRSPDGAWVRIQNAVVHDVQVAFRYENDIRPLRIWNSTVGAGVVTAFLPADSRSDGLDVRNLVVLGTKLPAEASDASNVAVGPSAFVDAARHDYRLSDGSPAVDAGTVVADVTADRAGVSRPRGRGHDAGAYER